MLFNLLIYFVVQPIAFLAFFIYFNEKKDLKNTNRFLMSVSLIPFLTLICYILLDFLFTIGRVPLYEFFIIDLDNINKYGLSPILMFYLWLISASYFVLYFFNKENLLGTYIYKILFVMFIVVCCETSWYYIAKIT